MTATFSVTGASVHEIASAVAGGALTPSEVLESVYETIDATEAKIQAWSQLDRERVRAEAAALTGEAEAGKLRGPLHGVPIAVKEEFYVEGMPTLFRGPDAWLESEDATIVARLRAAGAIIVGKTHMPIGGKNPPTRNPWNLAHTAGGSSSGSGAAVGARVVPLALGEQTAGSNLRPAAYCGVEGIKATYGRISRFGCYPFSWSRDHPGFIGLTMADMALALNVVSGYDPKDPTSLHDAPPPADLQMESYTVPKVGVVRNFFPERTEAVMQAAIEKSAQTMAAAGAVVEDCLLPTDYGLAWTAGMLTGPESAAFNADRRAGEPVVVANARMRASELIPATYFVQARRVRTYLIEEVAAMMRAGGYDALLMAVAPGAAPEGLESTGDASLLTPWSYLGNPAITVNGGVTPAGMPLGLQFVGAPKDEWNLMRLGAWCETTLGRLAAPVLP